MNREVKKPGLRTRAVHAGEEPDPCTGASAPNLVMSTTFVADPGASFSIEGFEEGAGYIYSRWANPTVAQLERKLAELEGAPACLAFASGMAAISALFLHLLRPGDRLLISDVSYAGAAELAKGLLTELGVEVDRVDMSDLAAVARALSRPARLVYIETPCNPILRLTDIASVAGLAHAQGAVLAADSTFATPVATRPLELGADYVLHSLTKYLCGHGDAVGGALLGPREEMARVRKEMLVHVGGVLSPFNAWLILRGAATLPLRMQAHEQAALVLARFLEGHPQVRRVIYPGLDSHPQHALAARQMANFSGILTFQVADGPAAARVLAERLRVIHYAVSLGHHRSLIFYMHTDDLLASSFPLIPEQEAAYRAFAGEGLFRLSVGLEDPEDLMTDLDQALQGL
ncbi:MAG: PLP-dependent transferase [Desulfarculus sp.]|nr:MAG: PLP-dependent transferase [Desulfarculus sp.]